MGGGLGRHETRGRQRECERDERERERERERVEESNLEKRSGQEGGRLVEESYFPCLWRRGPDPSPSSLTPLPVPCNQRPYAPAMLDFLCVHDATIIIII